MTVYVDNMEAPFSHAGMDMVMCHMFATTLPELLAMVDKIGVQRKWLQTPPKASWVHFDIAKSKRALAIKAGAQQVEWRNVPAYAAEQLSEPSYAVYYPIE